MLLDFSIEIKRITTANLYFGKSMRIIKPGVTRNVVSGFKRSIMLLMLWRSLKLMFIMLSIISFIFSKYAAYTKCASVMEDGRVIHW
jgi:hypothetical protein